MWDLAVTYVSSAVPVRRRLRVPKRHVQSVIGINIDTRASANLPIDGFEVLDGGWPMMSGPIDVCYAAWVLAHVQDPAASFSEATRALELGEHLTHT